MASSQFFDRIDAFHNDKLDKQERESFIQVLETNSDLKKENDAYVAALQITVLLGNQNLKEDIKKIVSEPKIDALSDDNIKSIRRFSIISIAATLLLLFFVGFLFSTLFDTDNNQVAENYYSAPNFSSVRASEDDRNLSADIIEYNSTIQSAISAFEDNEFDKCIDFINTISNQNTSTNYIQGMAYFNNKEWEKAHTLLSAAQANKLTAFYENAQWHYILTLIAQGNIDEAERLLQELVSNKSASYSNKAKELLAEL